MTTYTFEELVDIPKLQEMTDELYAATAIPSSIIDANGKVLTGAGWQRICTDFHRQHPQSRADCIASDTKIRKRLDAGAPFAVYRCPRGLVDASAPIVIGGRHLANVFSGQVFLEPPGKAAEQAFRAQALRFGFDEEEYMAAFREIPVLAEETFRAGIAFLAKLAHLIADMGLTRLKELESTSVLEQSEETTRALLDASTDSAFLLERDGTVITVNHVTAERLGTTKAELRGRCIFDFLPPRLAESRRRQLEEAVFTGETVRFEDQRADIVFDHIVYPIKNSQGEVARVAIFGRDITEEKKTLEKMRQDEEVLNEAQALAKVGSFVLDLRTDSLTWSRHMYAIAGLDPDRFSGNLGETIQQMIHEEDREPVRRQIAGMIEQKRTWPMEFRLVRPDGTVRWLRSGSRFTFDESGTPIVCVGVHHDITEQKQAKTALRLHEVIVSSASEPMAVIDRDYTFLLVNRSYEAFWGVKKQDIIGKRVPDIVGKAAFHNTLKEKVDRCLAGETVSYGAWFDSPTQGRRHMNLNYYPYMSDDGVVTGLINIAYDLTGQKRTEEALRDSEKRFRALAEMLPEAVFEADTQMNLTFVNQQAYSLFGYSQEDFEKGLNGFDMFAPEDRQRARENAEKRFGGAVHGAKEYWGLRKDGSTFPVLFHTSPIIQKGTATGLRGIIVDLTERKKTEEQLRQAQKMESIGILAGGIAHDFNNILFPIIGLAELLLEDLPADSLQHENAEEILKAGKRGSALVKQILAFSRQAGHERMPVRMQKIVREAVKLGRSTIPSSIEIAQHIQPDCGLVAADPSQLHQIVMNLITNAYHAVDISGGKISIALQETSVKPEEGRESALSPGRYAVLSVADNGAGIDPSIVHRIFEPYFTTKEQGKGTGLGLSVVYGIVSENGGDIEVASEPENGTVFRVYLPLMEQTTVDGQTEGVEAVRTGSESVLLVDDEEPIVRVEKRLLEHLGYRVTERTDSADALKLFRSDPEAFDLVITDMTMPKITGDRLAAEILAIRPDLPVVVCTGFSEKMNPEKAEALGIRALLMKPVIKADMARIVRKVLDET